MAEKFPYLYLLLLEGRPSVELPNKKVNQCDHYIVGAFDGTDATSLSWFEWHSPLHKSPFFLIHFFSLVFRVPKLDLKKERVKKLDNKKKKARAGALPFFG